jgi:hypothetical protein
MSDEPMGPAGYTVKDLVFWSGFMGGAIAAYGIMHALELDVHVLLRALVSMGAGVAVGWTCERIYTQFKRAPKSGPHPHNDDFNHIPGSPQ